MKLIFRTFNLGHYQSKTFYIQQNIYQNVLVNTGYHKNTIK